MKKSQLRKIIRESIKELINEQSGPTIISLNPNVRCVKTTNCPQPSGTYTTNATVSGQVPQVGQIIHGGTMHGRRAIIEVNPYQAGSCGSTIVNLPLSTSTDPCDACNNISGGCPGLGSPPSSGCDPSAWSNHASWTSTFTNTATNANNTCNFLNNKIAQFTNQIPNVGPVWANQLQCKLDLCNQLHASNNC
tara:strand:- start:223 stop:798 length:576 start_codon:yes stop_codon:yes gene_type:complete